MCLLRDRKINAIASCLKVLALMQRYNHSSRGFKPELEQAELPEVPVLEITVYLDNVRQNWVAP